jgi:hypothetical protein
VSPAIKATGGSTLPVESVVEAALDVWLLFEVLEGTVDEFTEIMLWKVWDGTIVDGWYESDEDADSVGESESGIDDAVADDWGCRETVIVEEELAGTEAGEEDTLIVALLVSVALELCEAAATAEIAYAVAALPFVTVARRHSNDTKAPVTTLWTPRTVSSAAFSAETLTRNPAPCHESGRATASNVSLPHGWKMQILVVAASPSLPHVRSSMSTWIPGESAAPLYHPSKTPPSTSLPLAELALPPTTAQPSGEILIFSEREAPAVLSKKSTAVELWVFQSTSYVKE